MKITDIVKNNRKVYFNFYRQGFFYYYFEWTDLGPEESMGVPDMYTFPVPIDDIGTATLLNEDRAITFMRWIRKSLEEKTLVKIKYPASHYHNETI